MMWFVIVTLIFSILIQKEVTQNHHHLTCVRCISLYYSLQALKTKHDTPKYGLIYHAQLVGQASAKLKGKVRL